MSQSSRYQLKFILCFAIIWLQEFCTYDFNKTSVFSRMWLCVTRWCWKDSAQCHQPPNPLRRTANALYFLRRDLLALPSSVKGDKLPLVQTLRRFITLIDRDVDQKCGGYQVALMITPGWVCLVFLHIRQSESNFFWRRSEINNHTEQQCWLKRGIYIDYLCMGSRSAFRLQVNSGFCCSVMGGAISWGCRGHLPL